MASNHEFISNIVNNRIQRHRENAASTARRLAENLNQLATALDSGVTGSGTVSSLAQQMEQLSREVSGLEGFSEAANALIPPPDA